MTTKITLAIFLFSMTACGQPGNLDCSKALERVPYFLRHSNVESGDSLKMDLDILKRCGNLDSIDSELLSGPMLGSILIEFTSADNEVTYNTILSSIKEFKKTEDYVKFRNVVLISKTLENKIVTVAGFEKDKDLLIMVGMEPSELEGFKLFIQADTVRKMTYKEAFAKYTALKIETESQAPANLEFTVFEDPESAIKSGKEQRKRVLLYFSGYGCINARRMEDKVLTNNRVKLLISKEYVYYIAYVDDNREDKSSGSTIGKQISKLQTEKFRTNVQPYFCIIDDEGNLQTEISYTDKAEQFIEFLKKGLK